MERTWPNWFTGGLAEQLFGKYLSPWAGAPGLRFLQVGAYCGDATVWMAEHILTDPASILIDVDTWQGSDEVDHEVIDFQEVHRFYAERKPAQVLPFRMTSDEFFRIRHQPFAFIYIDGAHTSEQVLRDAVNAEQLLLPGGLLAFDDYLWQNFKKPRDVPRPAIDSFVRCYEDKFDVLETGWQVWLQKRQ